MTNRKINIYLTLFKASFYCIKLNSEWTTTIGLPITDQTPNPIEVGINPHTPDAWINTYSNNCITQPLGSDPTMLASPYSNHIRISQRGTVTYGSIDEVGAGHDPHYDCLVTTDYYFKTDLEDRKLVLDASDNASNYYKYMSFYGPKIVLHQPTLIEGPLNTQDVNSTYIYGNTIATPTFNCTDNGFIHNLTVNNLNISQLSLGAKKPTGSYSTYLLSVDGTIVSKKEIVQITSWADKVFDKSYKLMPLSEVETYVAQNKHLPEIPSEAEVIENGVDVAEMNKLLLQKVEELTLHLIKQEKKIVALEAKVQTILK